MLLLISCAPKVQKVEVSVPKTEFVFFVPQKIASPVKPVFEKYDPNYTFNELNNFKKLQRNTVLMKNYINALRKTVKYYEDEIDMIEEKKLEYTKVK